MYFYPQADPVTVVTLMVIEKKSLLKLKKPK